MLDDTRRQLQVARAGGHGGGMDPREDGGLIGPFALTKDQLSKLESVSEVIGTVNIPAPNAVSPNVTVELDLEGRSAPRYV